MRYAMIYNVFQPSLRTHLLGRRARKEFDGAKYGDEYLTFSEGGFVLPREAPTGVDPDGWAFDLCTATGQAGWYPPRVRDGLS